jgi:hypothetical protein
LTQIKEQPEVDRLEIHHYLPVGLGLNFGSGLLFSGVPGDAC